MTDWGEPPIDNAEQIDRVLGHLLTIGNHHGASAAQVALSYLLGKPAITSVVIGARTEEQLADNLKATEIKLSASDRRLLDEASALPLIYPYWHQARHSRELLSEADLSLLGQYL